MMLDFRVKTVFPTALQRRQKEPSPPPSRLSQLNYAMLKETALRKKLQEMGIPNWGGKDLLKRRHIEWLNIYNSNCDADGSVRKSKRQLLKELEEWEQTQGGKADTKESKVMRKDFDGDGYMKSHKTDFDDLIARARQKRVARKPEESEGTKKVEINTVQSNSAPRDSTFTHDTHITNGTEPMVLHQPSPHKQGVSDYNTAPISPNAQHPYENNESALASIRAKVQEANRSPSKLPSLSSKRSMESTRRRGSTNSEGIQNPFGSPSRKVPMFALSEEPVRDVDSSNMVVQ